MFRICLSVLLLIPLCFADVIAKEVNLVAGRTIDDYAGQLDDQNRVIRLRAAKSLGSFGLAAGPALLKSLDNDDAAVRYIAAVHLGRLGGAPLKKGQKRLGELAADESSLAVRMAASYALCRLGQVDQHLPLLIETLEYPERGTACSAAELIGDVGPNASQAIGPLEAAFAKHRPGARGGDYHIGGAVANALRKVRPAQD